MIKIALVKIISVKLRLRYKKADELREKENLKKWVLVFVGDECVKACS